MGIVRKLYMNLINSGYEVQTVEVASNISQHHKISYSFITSTIPHIIQLDSVDERLKGLQDKRLKGLQDKRLRKGRFVDCYELMSGGVFDYKLLAENVSTACQKSAKSLLKVY